MKEKNLMRAPPTTCAAFLLLACLASAVHGAPANAKATPPAAKTPTPPRSFNPAVERLPPGFVGSDFGALFKTKRTAPKGEFETSDHYHERLKVVSGDSFYAVAMNLSASYDADRQRFMALIATEKLPIELTPLKYGYSRPVVAVKQARKESGKYVASNAFGVKTKVTRVNMIEDAVVLAHPYNDDITRNFNIPVPSDSASATKKALAFLFVFKPEPLEGAGLTATASGDSTPTIDFPYEVRTSTRYIFAGDAAIWAYDKTSGRVLGKIKVGRTRPPTYPGAANVVVENWNGSKQATEQVVSTDDSPDKVIAFYEGRLKNMGFTVTVNQPTLVGSLPIGSVLADSSDNKRHIRITVAGGLETTITYEEKYEEEP